MGAGQTKRNTLLIDGVEIAVCGLCECVSGQLRIKTLNDNICLRRSSQRPDREEVIPSIWQHVLCGPTSSTWRQRHKRTLQHIDWVHLCHPPRPSLLHETPESERRCLPTITLSRVVQLVEAGIFCCCTYIIRTYIYVCTADCER